jgi:hypothetical protein
MQTAPQVALLACEFSVKAGRARCIKASFLEN